MNKNYFPKIVTTLALVTLPYFAGCKAPNLNKYARHQPVLQIQRDNKAEIAVAGDEWVLESYKCGGERLVKILKEGLEYELEK